MIQPASGADVSSAMQTYIENTMHGFSDIDGFIL